MPEKVKLYIDKISNAAERMTKLIDDLLNFSRISRTNEQFEQTDLTRILQNVLADFDLIISEKKAVVKYDPLPVIEAIPVQMEQLFHNLLSNALKFSRNDVAPEIHISWRELPMEATQNLLNHEEPVSRIEIVFKDNGIGFNAEFAEQIFNIFQRLNASKEYPGTGIGLALCRRIVNNHGGDIYAESKEGEGATFHVVLPVRQGQDS